MDPNFFNEPPICWETPLLDSEGKIYLDLRHTGEYSGAFHHTSMVCPDVLGKKEEEKDTSGTSVDKLLECEIGMLDADVYQAFTSPGHHALPPEIASQNPSYLIIPNQPWFSKTRITLDDGSLVSEDQILNVRKLETRERKLITPNDEKWIQKGFADALLEMNKIIEKEVPYPELLTVNVGGTDVKTTELENEIIHELYCVVVPYLSVGFIENWNGHRQRIKTASQLKRQTLQKKYFRQTIIRRDRREIKALATFRDLVTEKEFRRYLTNGFHVVKGQGNYWYQIFNDQREIVIWKNNERYNRLCIHTDKGCPPTDHVLNMMYLIKFDEEQFWKMGNLRLDPPIETQDMARIGVLQTDNYTYAGGQLHA